MDDRDRVALAREAAMLTKSQAFIAATENYRASLLAAFAKTAPGDVAAWTLLHTKLEVLKGFGDSLGAIMTSGDRANTNLHRTKR